MKVSPARLRAGARRGASTDGRAFSVVAGGSTAKVHDIIGQHWPAACLAVPCVGAWIGGRRRMVRTIGKGCPLLRGATGCIAATAPNEGARKPIRAISQTRVRARVMSAATIVQHFDQLLNLDLAVALVAGMEGVRHAMLQMVVQDLLLDLVDRRPHRADLGQHVDAVAVLLDHARHAAHLALDAAEAGELGFLDFFVHGLNHTPVGYTWQVMKHDHHHGPQCHHEETATDPVCGMKVRIEGAKNTTVHDGQTHYFCSPRCLAKFTAEPARYLKPAEPAAPMPAGTIFTCPMHPEIRQVGPGSCPICGMALEPAEASLDHGPNEELLDMTRRLWIGGALTVPVVALDMGGHLFDLHALLPHGATSWLLLVLATPVVLWAGWPFFVRGWQSVRTRNLNMFTLIALGTGMAWLYSVVATIAPGLFPPAFRSDDGSVPVYFEPAAVIIVLVLVGQVLELRARDATGGAIKALLGLAPRTALRIGTDGHDAEVPIEEIAAGDRLRVRPGEKVPVDGARDRGP